VWRVRGTRRRETQHCSATSILAIPRSCHKLSYQSINRINQSNQSIESINQSINQSIESIESINQSINRINQSNQSIQSNPIQSHTAMAYKRYSRYQAGDPLPRHLRAYGIAIAVSVSCLLALLFYALAISKLLPDTGFVLLDAIKHDRYYSYLLAATIPVTLIFIYFNWLSLKFFRHS